MVKSFGISGAIDGPAGATCLLRKYGETPKIFLVLGGLGATCDLIKYGNASDFWGSKWSRDHMASAKYGETPLAPFCFVLSMSHMRPYKVPGFISSDFWGS
jgi:hypothetical protein